MTILEAEKLSKSLKELIELLSTERFKKIVNEVFGEEPPRSGKRSVDQGEVE